MIVRRLAFRKVPISGAPSLPPPPLRLISLRRCRRAAAPCPFAPPSDHLAPNLPSPQRLRRGSV